ncbi:MULTISPECIES: DinB family protein [unclassified Mucilaginibacter]|uniref:DinB family protein n=1 Tax=unclassified Mucilaginibacter TaxID=2617802 RepID=UPI002AC9E3C2|nr:MULTISPECIES: DinB family protein [unclassified Mucilaginibacter]MEB0262794.1 DinB family protein [Mucilaginibacter sp. 10I4]MEB0278177.1 DinB family protein [Mucilaginibacter sp. 10B2]MEB0302059.1 DinB family protein [Mucilaginibacter sp. 5C4]WPX23824.1 DinB family protein [Mucilaginibacter sp. 5C4]
MKRIFTLMFFLGAIYTVKAQSTDSLQVQLARKWVNSKSYALKLAALMPEDGYDFKASPEEMSFREQLLHIADNMTWLSSSFLLVNAPSKRAATEKLSKAAVLKVLGDAYDLGLSAHMKINVSQLDDHVKFFSGPMTRRQILILMHDHQTHHLGQLVVYLRLNGIKPPEYVGW